MITVNFIGNRWRHQVIEGAMFEDEEEALEWGQLHADQWGCAVEMIDDDTNEMLAIIEPSETEDDDRSS